MRIAPWPALLLASLLVLAPGRSGGQMEELLLVRFESEPEGARVLLDGAAACGTEGGCTRLLRPGRRTVRMELEGYVPREAALDLADGQVIRWALEANFGLLTVESVPPGLMVTVDGVPLGQTPLRERRVEQGTRRVAVEGPCVRTAARTVQLRRGARATVTLNARTATRTLDLRVQDESGRAVRARVLVDGNPAGQAPGRLVVEACATALSLEGAGGSWSGLLPPADGGVTRLDVTLSRERRPDERIFIPEGFFLMGCNEAVDTGCDDDERPGRQVWLDAYSIDVSEVTVAQYRACVDAGACEVPEPGMDCNWGVEGRDQHPANCVNWFQAGTYCAWAGGSLPTEAQWEKAARGTDGRIWPWGNEPPTCAVCVMGEGGPGCGTGGTLPVCSRKAGLSPWGACDMSGNVMEWVQDPQDGDFYGRAPERNPLNPGGDPERLHCLRGGERAYTIIEFLRTSNRDGLQPMYSNYGIGFRCAAPAK